jgi:hypothetical protein
VVGIDAEGPAVKLRHVALVGVGYVLGTRAGRERYEQIVSLSRRVAGSQTVQSTAGVVQAQVDQLTSHVRGLVAERLTGAPPADRDRVNGSR